MVQYLEVPSTTVTFSPTTYHSSKTRSLINGFYSSSARNPRDSVNCSSYTRRSNSDYGLPRIYQTTPPIPGTPSPVPSPSPSSKRFFARIQTPIINTIRRNEHSPKLFHSAYQGHERLFTQESRQNGICVREGLRIFGAEALGTAILMCVGCTTMTTMVNWTFAVGAIIAIHTVGPVSGAHLNPGVTIVACIMKKLKLPLVPIYIIAQFVGAIVGYGFHYGLVLDEDSTAKCITVPYENYTAIQTLGVEILMSFIFFISIAALFDEKNKNSPDIAALKLGLILFGLITSVWYICPLSMNTARSLAPSIFNNQFDAHWIYWVGPNVAAVIAGGIYRFLFYNRPYQATRDDNDLS